MCLIFRLLFPVSAAMADMELLAEHLWTLIGIVGFYINILYN